MVTSADLLAAALRYAELGYRVFPCVPNGKSPLTAHGFHDAVTDAEQIARWWSQHPLANVGIAAKGLLVVDVDGKDNPWPGDPDRSADLAGAGAIATTPRGGRHYLFRRPAGKGWKCSTGQVAPGVDIRTDGGYIVAAPSVTADGVYAWGPDLELHDAPGALPEPPVWLAECLDRASEPRTLASASGSGNTIPMGQRNATLARLAGLMRRIGMTREEIAAGISRANQDRCEPPLSGVEVARIAASIARYSPDAVTVAFVESHYEQMFAESPVDDDDPEPEDPGPVPDRLLRVPGFVEEVAAYNLATAPYPEPVLAFTGALVLQGVLAGRKVRDGMGNRTNLYVLNLADSGVGKDHARKVNAEVLLAAGQADRLGTSFASGEGIEDALFAQPVTLFQVDEIDGLLLRVSQAKDARHEAIVSMLLQMYTSASSVYVMRARAGRPRAHIAQPSLSLFGTAVPDQFYDALTARLASNGFLARLLVVECRERGEGRDDVAARLPESVVAAARWWAEFRPGGNLAAEHPDPVTVPVTPEALEAFAALRVGFDQAYKASRDARDQAGMSVWARAYEKSRRLALIYACSENRERPMIGIAAAEWAGAFALHQTRRMLYMLRRHASDGEFDLKRKRLIDVLDRWRSRHGDAWMPFWKVSRSLPWPPREHDELREVLVEQRLIEARGANEGNRGRPGLVYRLLTPTPKASSGGEE